MHQPVLRPILSVVAMAGALAACAPVETAPPPVERPVTPFTYRASTPLVQRAFDINECELAGRGLPPNASDSQISAATASLDPEQIAVGVRSCLAGRGYTITELPVCLDEDFSRGTLLIRPDVFPPLDSILCLDPSRGGMVTSQPPAVLAGIDVTGSA